MKVKKSMFAKLLALALPMAAISVVTPIVLTSCGSSTSETNKTQASWDTTKTQDGLTFDTTNNSAVITLKDDGAFAGTSISKKSTFDEIKKSLDPTSTGTSLFSVLSGAIKDVGNYNVKLSVDTNPIVFDYSNDAIGNYFNGQFQLTPKSGSGDVINLNFRVNNFNDSYNGKDGKDLQWDVSAIQTALNSTNTSTGNSLPDVTPTDNGASVTIDLSKNTGNNGLGKVMDELCQPKSTIKSDELKKFIKNYSSDTNFDSSKATISNWAPTVDGTKVFTRIVVPSKTGGQDAVLYIAYTGLQKDDGNGIWNRNISYPNGATWDTKYNEPVIYLSKLSGNIGNTLISNNSTYEDITDIGKITPVVHYMKDNYIMGSDNFSLCFTGVKGDSTIDNNTIVPGVFDTSGIFSRNDNGTNSNNNAVEFKFFLELKKDHNTSASTRPMGSANNSPMGIWRSFYIVYKDNSSSSNK